jgi:hypothetical protein
MAVAHELRCSSWPGTVAELVPLPARSAWVSRQRVAEALIQADAGLRDDLAEALPETVDEL